MKKAKSKTWKLAAFKERWPLVTMNDLVEMIESGGVEVLPGAVEVLDAAQVDARQTARRLLLESFSECVPRRDVPFDERRVVAT